MVDVPRKHISATIYGSTFGDTVFFKRCFGDRGGRCKIRLQNDVSQRGRLAKSPTSSIYMYVRNVMHFMRVDMYAPAGVHVCLYASMYTSKYAAYEPVYMYA